MGCDINRVTQNGSHIRFNLLKFLVIFSFGFRNYKYQTRLYQDVLSEAGIVKRLLSFNLIFASFSALFDRLDKTS